MASMCRLLGIVASEETEFRVLLREAPRSLATLSREHGDGWGLAVYKAERGWEVHKSVLAADGDAGFHERAMKARGDVLVSHVRKKTVGVSSIENTHPFSRDGWVLAHNGTVHDTEFLRKRTSRERLAQLEGQTDSELLFAFLLTRLDEAGATKEPPGERADSAIAAGARECQQRAASGEGNGLGTFNFLLAADGVVYAHRFGRTLFLLERGPHDDVRTRRETRDGVIVETPWKHRQRAVFVASEGMTDEPWAPLEEGVLLRIDRQPAPAWRALRL